MPVRTVFPGDVVEAFRRAKILGVRAGSTHRFTGVWVVVVGDRPFVRSWNDKPTGWFRAFRKNPDGAVQIDGRELPVRASVVGRGRVRDAVTTAYAEKYNTKASKKWVEGLHAPARVLTTLELLPR